MKPHRCVRSPFAGEFLASRHLPRMRWERTFSRVARAAALLTAIFFGGLIATFALADSKKAIDELAHGDAISRQAAMRNLAHAGRSVMPDVVPLLSHPDPEVRRAVLVILEQLQAIEVLPHIVQALNDSDSGVRAAAVKTVGLLGDRGVARALLERLQDPDETVRILSMFALAHLGAQESVPSLLSVMSNGKLSEGERRASILAAGGLHAQGTSDELLRILQNPDENEKTRGLAAQALGALSEKRTLPLLIGFLSHQSSVIRYHAVASLGAFKLREVERALGKVLRDESEEDFIRIRSAWSLSALRSSSSIEYLVTAAREEREFIAMHAVRALVAIGVPEGREAAVALKRRSKDSFVQTTMDRLLQSSNW